MSHWTNIKTQIRDVDALREACRELGLSLIKNAIARGYSSNEMRGDYVIRCQGPYDIAVNRQPDGTYGLTTDWYTGSVAKQVGEGFRKLVQLYGVHKATIEARKKGLTVARSQLPNGSIRLNINMQQMTGPKGVIP